MPELKKRPFRNLRALVVEDNHQTRKLIDMILRKAGAAEVDLVENGEIAWEMVRSNAKPYDFIICDWNMPKMSGIELLENIRQDHSRLPFVMITGRGSTDSVVDAHELGVTAYLPKPFTPQRLVDKLEAVLFSDIELPA